MKQFFARLSPIERRFVVAVMVVVFLVLNIAFVWPQFGDWDKLKTRIATAQTTLATYMTATNQLPGLENQVKSMEREGAAVAAEDQAVDLLQAINKQSAESGVNIISSLRPSSRTNLFFVEQVQTFNIQSGESQLVDFLYNLGAGKSTIRVRDLSIHPELPQRQQLGVTVKLVASYQKKPAIRPAAPGLASTAAKPATPNQR